jgi:putative tricarboxylic transport membrane protein
VSAVVTPPTAQPTSGPTTATTTARSAEEPRATGRVVDTAQYGLAGALVAIGGYVAYDASTLGTGRAASFLPPTTFAYLVAGALVLLGAALAVATRRGDVPEAEEGEDVDLSGGSDLRTIVLLVLVLSVNVLFIETLGWAITGAILFTGAAWVLGSRHWVRDLAIGVALSLGTFYGFYLGLGVPLPAGILDGIL